MTQEEAVHAFKGLPKVCQTLYPDYTPGSEYLQVIGHDPLQCHHTEGMHQHWVRTIRKRERLAVEREEGWLEKIQALADERLCLIDELEQRKELNHEQAEHLRSIIHEYRTSAGSRDRMAALIEYGKLRHFYTQHVKMETVKPPSETDSSLDAFLDGVVTPTRADPSKT